MKAPRPVLAIPSKARSNQNKGIKSNPTPSPFPLLHAQPTTSSTPSSFSPRIPNPSSLESATTNPSNPAELRRREPPLVEQARKKSVKQRSIWESYLVLDSRTRLLFSLGLGVVGLVGLYVGDLVQEEEVLADVVAQSDGMGSKESVE